MNSEDKGFQERLVLEYKQLVERRIILERTLIDCKNIDLKHQELLSKQLDAMMQYETILFERIIILMK